MNINASIDHEQALPDEPLPPYSPFEATGESDSYAAAAAPIWEPPQPPEWLELSHEPEVVATGPTDMTTIPSDTSTLATQLLRPANGISLKLEGFKAAKVVVRTDNEQKYNGLVSISARFRHNPVSLGSNESPVRASSQAAEKTGMVQIEFAVAPEQHADSCEVVAKLDLVLPRGAMLPCLVFRLPANSSLEFADIPRNTIERVDAAVVLGVVGLNHVHAGSLRVAIGDGHVKAAGVTVSHGPAEFVAMRGYIHVYECIANGGSVRVNAPDAIVKLKSIAASKVQVRAARAPTTIHSVVADAMTVESVSGHLALDDIAVRVLEVSAETSPVTGSWDIGERIHVAVASAIIQGRLSVTGDNVHAYFATSEWPVRLSICRDFVGHFDIRTTNGVVNLGLAEAVLSKDQPHHRQGTIGAGTNGLSVMSTNSPVVIDTY
ncbi:hypothetical protein IWW38_000676 [Coemansia aciculifera]|uniref:Uncharacterized protein n=1 Tax=Coemansia aciculifera TaxID=417176 RepID=A0ACC1M945_9FUNG|nr:hypothetical protein IWW38_000676 [Coemansia aciculifera]